MSRYGKGFIDQEAPKKYPDRHIRVFRDPMSDEPQVCVFVMNNPRDIARTATLNLEHAEQMGQLLLELVAQARAEAQETQS